MKKQVYLILPLLALLGLACTLSGGSLAAITPTGSPTATPTPSLTPTATSQPTATPAHLVVMPTPARWACEVKTGIESGRLTLRAGPGLGYPALAWLEEGSLAFPLLSQADNWRQVQAGDLQGWVYAGYLSCP